MTIFSNGCVKYFVSDLKVHKVRMHKLLLFNLQEGRMSVDMFNKTKEEAIRVSEEVEYTPMQLKYLLDMAGVKVYRSSLDIIALISLLTGKIPAVGIDYAYLNHPMRYKLFDRIAYLLKSENDLDTKDRMRLFQGRSKEIQVVLSLEKMGETNDYKIWKDDTFIYTIEKDGINKSISICRNYVNGNIGNLLVEMSYLRKGVLVYYRLGS